MIKQWFTTIEKIANKYNDTEFILPIHPNPNVKQHKDLFKKVCVVEPLSHNEMIKLVKSCRLIISDSGGIQEEASYLNKKIIICREDTERPEVLDSGHGILCPKPEFLEDIFARVYEDFYINSYCPFGDGYSHKRIKTILESLE
jgi:UDP-N-acetylglucosamine 2-epimerase (non-hydrolysing)